MANEKKKKVLLWGPISSFTGPLVAWITKKGWYVDIVCKSSLNLLSLSPLDLKSAAAGLIEKSFQSRNKAKAFSDKYRFVETLDAAKKTKYDAIVFAGLPPNFDESRGPRAPWSAQELEEVVKVSPEADLIVVSSIYAGVRKEDGVVPEELDFERRKPETNWENTCQQYESKLHEILAEKEFNYSLVRLPLICGSTDDGKSIKHNGLYSLIKELKHFSETGSGKEELRIEYQPDATLWYLPIDTAVYVFWRFLEDSERPKLLNMVPTNPCLNREWLQHLSAVFGVKSVIASENVNIEPPQAITKLLKDNVQVTTTSLFEAAGRYHIPPFIADENYFRKVIDAADEYLSREGMFSGTKEIQKAIDSDKLMKLYFEDFLPTVLNTNGFLDKAIQKGKEIGFKFKDTSEALWILKSSDGESVAEKVSEDKKPSVCFKLSGQTLFKLLEKKLPLHRAVLLREVEVVGNPIKIMKVVRLVEKSFDENTLSKDQLEEVIA